jgi:hypothetical protein
MTDPTRLSRRQSLIGPGLAPLERATLAFSLVADPDEPPLTACEAKLLCARLVGHEVRALHGEQAFKHLVDTLEDEEFAEIHARLEAAYRATADVRLRSLEELAEALERTTLS